MDIVEWLRDYYHMDSTRYTNLQIADEIERLRAANKDCILHFDCLKEDYDKSLVEIERLREALQKIADINVKGLGYFSRLLIARAKFALQQKDIKQ